MSELNVLYNSYLQEATFTYCVGGAKLKHKICGVKFRAFRVLEQSLREDWAGKLNITIASDWRSIPTGDVTFIIVEKDAAIIVSEPIYDLPAFTIEARDCVLVEFNRKASMVRMAGVDIPVDSDHITGFMNVVNSMRESLHLRRAELVVVE